MTTATTTPRLSYTADGSTAAFTFNFEIADSSSIAVYVGSTLKTLTTDYTVSFDTGTSGTGTVTFTSAPSSGTVTLIRDTNLARTVDFQEGGAFLAATVNAEFDRLSQAVIDATDKIENRALSTTEPNTDTATMTIPVAADRANKVLSFDSSGNAQVTSAGTGSVTSIGLTTSGNDLTITGSPVTTSGNINIEMANPITVNVTGNVTGDVTGNADTATALETARTIAGQSFDGTGNITIASTDLSNTSNITLNDATQTLTNKTLTSPTITGTGSIAGTFTGNIAGDVTGNITATTGTSTLNDLRVSGDLTVDGTNTIINTDTLAVEDNIIMLNRNVSGTPSVDAGIEVERGTSTNKQFVWDESEDKWSITGETLIAGGIETGSITTVSNGDITLAPNGTGRILLTPGTNGVQVTTGNFSVNAGYLESEGIRIEDNEIKSVRSNDNIIIDPAGTGEIQVNSNIDLNGFKITGGSTDAPVADGDLAHKKYVDDQFAGAGYVTPSSTDTFTNKTFDANGIGNSISNIEVADLASGVLDTDISTVSGSDDTLASAKAIKTYIDAQNTAQAITFVGDDSSGTAVNSGETFKIAGGTNITTAVSGDTLTITGPTLTSYLQNVSEDTTPQLGGNLDLNSSDITGTGNISITGNIANDAISISDNSIATTRSNDDLNISAAGTGVIKLDTLSVSGNSITGSNNISSITMDNNVTVHLPNQGEGSNAFLLSDESGANQYPIYGVTGSAGVRYRAVQNTDVGMTVLSTVNQITLKANNIHIDGTVRSNTGDLTIQGATTNDSVYVEGTQFYNGGGRSQIFTDEFHTDGIQIIDNEITGRRSNEDINITASGTGNISLGNFTFDVDQTVGSGQDDYVLTYDHSTGSISLESAAGGTITALNNQAANRLTTIGATTTELDGEANLTFDGSTLAVTGAATVSTTLGVSGTLTTANIETTGTQTITNTTTDDSLLITTTEDSSTAAPVMSFKRNSTSPADGDYLGQLKFKGENDADQEVIYAKMTAKISDVTDTTEDGLLEFALRKAGSNNIGMRLTSSDLKLINGTGLTSNGNISSEGSITATTTIGNDAITIDDNHISTSRSNDDLVLETNGTGYVQISASGGEFSNYSSNVRYSNGNHMYHEDLSATIGSGDRAYKNTITSRYKLAASQTDSSNSSDRWRNQANMYFDANGNNTTNSSTSYRSRGPMALDAWVQVDNTSSSSATVGNASGGNYGIGIYPAGTGDLTVSRSTGMGTYLDVSQGSGDITITDHVAYNSVGIDRYGGAGTMTITDFYHNRAMAHADSASGTLTLTNNYAFYAEADTVATNNYAFYSASDTAVSRVGSLERYREEINALTSSSTITVDCGLAPVHTVTLAENTQFVISNLGTGQTVTIIITQDAGGSNTASFGTDGSTAVKFAGGTPTLSTAGSAIDVVTIFNDGTNYLGNLASAYAA